MRVKSHPLDKNQLTTENPFCRFGRQLYSARSQDTRGRMSEKVELRLQSIAESLSKVFSKPVRLFENPARESDDRWVIDTDGAVLTEPERLLTSEVLILLDRQGRTDENARGLEQRLRVLERENVELAIRNRALAEASSRDSLTGLFNRSYVMDKIEAELNRALRFGAPISVLMLDLDHFKNVNDRYGHIAGDRVLQTVGALLKDSCRVYDVPGRYGGEEFCLVLPETKLDSSMSVAERIRARLEATTLDLQNGSVRITTSIGVASVDSNSNADDDLYAASALIDRADRALYMAKGSGRNRVVPFSNAAVVSVDH